MNFTPEQVETLLRPIRPERVIHSQGHSHVAQHDVRAHLNRIFGFGNWDYALVNVECIQDSLVTVPGRSGKPARENVPAVTYRCHGKLTIRNPGGEVVAQYEDVATGSSPNLPTYGDSHDFAIKVAASMALKRCAVNLGDQFGLSLYNDGQTTAFVRTTLVGREPNDSTPVATDVQEGVAAVLSDEEFSTDAEPQAKPEPQTKPAEAKPTAPTTVPATRAAIARKASELKWTLKDVEADYLEWNNEKFIDADVALLTEYLSLMEKRNAFRQEANTSGADR